MSIQDVISLELLNDCKLAFDKFDEDNDGYLEARLIERGIRALGFNPTHDEIIDILSDIGNKMISFEAFLYIVYKHARNSDTIGELEDALRVFDSENTGCLYVETLKRLFKSVRKPFTDAQIDEILSEMVIDKEMVNYREFIRKLLYK